MDTGEPKNWCLRCGRENIVGWCSCLSEDTIFTIPKSKEDIKLLDDKIKRLQSALASIIDECETYVSDIDYLGIARLARKALKTDELNPTEKYGWFKEYYNENPLP